MNSRKVSPTTAIEETDFSAMSSSVMNSSLETEAGPSHYNIDDQINSEDINMIVNSRVPDPRESFRAANLVSDVLEEEEDNLTSFIPTTVEIAVRVKKVNLSYREKILNSLTNASSATPVFVLNGISLTVPSGSIYGLLGPSGCGKTSLLRCM
jgi:ABC-type glutathione transport system ATPase component